jgi:signal transduction histidine kinase
MARWHPLDGSDRDNVRCLIYLILFALSIATFKADANPLVLEAQNEKIDLNESLTYLRDPGGRLTLDDVAALPMRNAFTRRSEMNFAITTDAIWLRVEVQLGPAAPAEWWLALAPAYIGEVALYLVHNDSDRVGQLPSRAGIALPLSIRELKVRHSTFKIHLGNSEKQTIYLRLRSNTQLNVRASLWQPLPYAERSATENLLLGFYYGAFVLIISLSIVRWKIKRTRVDFWWIVYLLAEGISIFRMNGLASLYVFPEVPLFNTLAGTISISCMVWAGTRFGIHAFALDQGHYRYSYRAAVWIGSLALLAGFGRLIDLEPASSICIFITAFLLCLLNCLCSYRFLNSGEPAARFYFLGIWFMTACLILVLGRNFGFIPVYQFIDYIWQTNLIIHASLITVGMVVTQRETNHERRRATDFRASAESSLRYSNLQKKMVTLVSHEFRNSLAMLNVSMHAINKRKDLPSEVIDRHRNIVRVHHQMRRVIDDFLIVERIQNTDIKISYHSTDIVAVIREAIAIAELHSKEHHIVDDYHHLPHFLSLDDGILRLTLTNLLDNAVKYSSPGSRIVVHGRYGDGLLQMSVSDNGIGMNADSLSRLFEPHFKADLQSEGIGIGLYMVRMRLHAHDGDLRVTSTVGNGTTLKFWLRAKLTDDSFQNANADSRLSH